jgi:cytochrome c oxidase accessory protein FixG
MSNSENKSDSFFADWVNVYPKAVKGRFRRLKWISLAVLLGVYYLGPWLRWDRGDDAPGQALIVDLASRKAYFFFVEIWAQEVYYFTGILIIAAITLFFATALAGRVWCGYACPQTVWTDLFMWVERRIEGDRAARMRLDKSPISIGKVVKKISKHIAWLFIAFATGGAWVFYFNDAPTLLIDILTVNASFAIYAIIFSLTASTYLMAGWARESVCTYMCPYARFQGAMLDDDSLVVTYDTQRGESRGPHKKGTTWEGRGDCIDCNACVAVCPTGIDIRDGLQLECIGCGLCADACNNIMDRVDRPRGLIRYDTLRIMNAKAAGKDPKYHLIRPRTIVYTLILLIVIMVMLAALILRTDTSVNVLRDRNPLFVTLADGSVRNGYTIKILNMKRENRTYHVKMAGVEGAKMTIVGHAKKPVQDIRLKVRPDSVGTFRVFVHAARSVLKSASDTMRFVITEENSQKIMNQWTTFRGPEK